uniref:Helicase ATP-binding domain-containing protein n=1 Tax=viral metagenome TaxID=1070528 RepID=A0A6C0LLX9_9ZZZZ
MNNLDILKQKMMIKPIVQDRELVAVLIKGTKNKTNRTVDPSLQTEEVEEKEEEKDESDVEEKEEGTEEKEEKSKEANKRPLIIDESYKQFDRNSVLEKLKQSTLTKVADRTFSVAKPDFTLQKTQTTAPKLIKRPKKIKKLILSAVEEDEEPVMEEQLPKDALPQDIIEEELQKPAKKRERVTQKVEKGVAVIGPETKSIIGDTSLKERLPVKPAPIIIKVPNYYMNNREIFINFINSLFDPYKKELANKTNEISCDNIGEANSEFSLLTHQKIVRDYMNLYTPYRGVLLFHGLGSGKTASSIAITEGMKDAKRIIIMTPASLRANYIEELKKAGDLFYKKNQFWEWISTDENPSLAQTISGVLNLPQEYIRKQHGAWFINIKKQPNYDQLSDIDRKSLDKQLDEMIRAKYTFINYNGLRSKKLGELTAGYTKNLFDNSVVVIDEAHNLISRIVNKLSKEKDISESSRGEKDHLPTNLATKLYEYLLSAKNARIVLLTGTPVINYPNEFGILFNILRGYIKTWYIPLNIKTTNKIDKFALQQLLLAEKTHDYIDYSPSTKTLIITRNPYGFKNKIKKTSEYQGVSNSKKDDQGNFTFEVDFVSDDDFERKIISILKRSDIEVISSGIRIKNHKALPDKLEHFYNRYIEEGTGNLKNVDALKRRIIGLSSYFKSAQESLLPKYNKQLGVDYHIVRIPMSNFQFKIYEGARRQERKTELAKKKPSAGDDMQDHSSTYKIFSRLFCNFVMPNRPLPKDIALELLFKENELSNIKEMIKKELEEKSREKQQALLLEADDSDAKEQLEEQFVKTIDDHIEMIYAKITKQKKPKELKEVKEKSAKGKEKGKEKGKGKEKDILFEEAQLREIEEEIARKLEQLRAEEKANEGDKDKDNGFVNLIKDARREEGKQDVSGEEEAEIEGDEILDKIGGDTYKQRIEDTLRFLQDNSNDYLTKEALQTYSPKFLHILDNIQDEDYSGLHLVYSQFRTLEGIGIFSLVLEKNGFTRFTINKNAAGVWKITIPDEKLGQPTYALYTGTETSEEKEIIRHIYNGEWDLVPETISSVLNQMANNNNMGEIIKVLMITSSGSEGINLRNTRYVHIIEPYWHPVRTEQVIGRARRICSHKNLPEKLQTVEVFIYLMSFTDEQLNSDEAIELKRKDLSKQTPKVPLTSDQNLFEISEIKANLSSQLVEAVKQTAFDCYIYSNGKCVNFGDPTNDKFSFVPDYAEQQNDTTVQANKIAVTWTGKSITIMGTEYIYKRINPKLLNIYDKSTYEQAIKDSSIVPLQIGTVEINEKGQEVFKQLVT